MQVWKEAEPSLLSTSASLVLAGPESNSRTVKDWRAGLADPERVHLVGSLHPEQIPEYIRSSDVVLVPSMDEGLPNVAMEASACGRAVFGSNVGGIPEVIQDQNTGLVLGAGDVAAWRNALVSCARQLAQVQMMGLRARERAERLFDSKRYTTEILDLYRTVSCTPAGKLNQKRRYL
jgi:glycosyltransferase involved in cell wall biosynthesis